MSRFVLLLSIVLAIFSLDISGQYKQSEFIIGTFADPNLSRPENFEKDVAAFKRAKDAYFNLMTGPQFYTGARDFSMLDRLLKVTHKVGLNLLAIDSRLSVGEDTFTVQKANFIINHFKGVQNRSLLGYNFGGEFGKEHTAKILKWIGYFKKNHPGKLAYTYLLPSYGFSSRKEYEKYVDGYLKPSNMENIPDVVAFDHYPFIGEKELRDDYFYNLKIIANKAGQRPFWVYVLTTKHLIYPEPGEYQLFYTCFSPIAYGAKGIMYFTYETLPYEEYGTGLLDKNENPTKKFYIANRINHYIHDIVGPAIMQSTRIGTWHSRTAFSYENLSDQVLSKNNTYIKSIDNGNILIGVFKNKTKPIHYLYLVNKSYTTADGVNVNVNPSLGNRYTISPSVNDYDGVNKAITLMPIQANQQSATLRLSLKPGEGKIITILK